MRLPSLRSLPAPALGLVLWLACGPAVSTGPAIDHDDPRAQAEAAPPPPNHPEVLPALPVAPQGPGAREITVARAQLIATLDAGVGSFLRGFEVAAVLDGSRFTGWRLVQTLPGERRFDGLDVVPGDVLVAVNGQVLSKPDDLFALWQSLRSVDTIVCDLVRNGMRFQVRLVVSGEAIQGT